MRQNRQTSDPSLLGIPTLGVFADWSMPSTALLVSVARSFDVVVLGILPKEPFKRIDEWEPSIPLQKTIDTALAALKLGLGVVVMAWMGRGEKQIRLACSYVESAVQATKHAGHVRGLLDCEKTYDTGVGVHPLPYDVADDLVASELATIEWGVTGISPGVDDSLVPLLKLAKFRVPQAYSIYKPTKVGETHWSHNPVTFPGVMQRRAFDRWSAVLPLDVETRPKVVMGLANYWGARPATVATPSITHEQMLRFSCAETSALPGVEEAWFWSLKWHFASRETRAFFGDAS